MKIMSEFMETIISELFFKNLDILLLNIFNMSGKIGENLLALLLKKIANFYFQSFENDSLNANQVQEKLLAEILTLNQNTVYGQKNNFAQIKNAQEFRKLHPITTYEHYHKTIEEIARTGNYNLLVAEPIILFQQTSGTTGESKLIPRTNRLSNSLLKSFQIIESVINTYFDSNNFQQINHRGVTFVNTIPLQFTPSGIPKGTGTSGGIRQTAGQSKLLQKLLQLKFSSPFYIFLIPDHETAYYCHLLFALIDADLIFISANFSSNILEAMQILSQNWEQLIQDIKLGQLNPALKLDKNIRENLQNRLEPNPERAEILTKEFRKGMKEILPRIWTKLFYIQCITTGSMQVYQEKLQYYAGQVPFYSGAYGASEAWIGVNLSPQRNSVVYIMTPHSAFFEFIRESEIDQASPSTLDFKSLQKGENYEIVVTNFAGLYRYRLGDVIKCVGYYNESPMIEFLYRRHSLLNLVGEKVPENIILMALNKAISAIGYQIIEYTTHTEINSYPWKYIIYAELSEEIKNKIEQINCQEYLDQSLKELHELYRDLRNNNTLGSVKLKFVQKETFKLLKSLLLQDSPESQFKMPRLLTNQQENLINFLNNRLIIGE